MGYLRLFLGTVKNHQLVVLLSISVLAYGSCQAYRIWCKVFGDEDYPPRDWIMISFVLFALVLASFILSCALILSFAL
jgi:hypothetical protein